jgi:uncharacterized phage protein (predicted DNA packaging)
MAYVTTAQVKRYINIDTDTTTDDTLIDDLIPRAQAEIDAHCNRTFEASANSTRYFNAVEHVERDGRNALLYLDNDLCAINSITNGDGTTVTALQYTTQPRNETPYFAIKLLASSGVAWTYDDDPEDAIAISGKWAYSTSAPADIVQSCIELVVWMYRRRDTFVDFERPQMSPDGTYFVPTSMPKGVEARLKRYKRTLFTWQTHNSR